MSTEIDSSWENERLKERIAALEAKVRELEAERDRAEATIRALHYEYKIPFEVDDDAPLKLCEVCGAPVLYGSRHHQCGSFVMNIETELTASRQQVERLVEALRRMCHATSAAECALIADEALATVEKDRK